MNPKRLALWVVRALLPPYILLFISTPIVMWKEMIFLTLVRLILTYVFGIFFAVSLIIWVALEEGLKGE